MGFFVSLDCVFWGRAGCSSGARTAGIILMTGNSALNPGWGVRTPTDELPVPVSVQKGSFAPAKKPKCTGMSEEKK